MVKSLDDVRAAADAMIGKVLVTKQTGEAGKLVSRVYVEDGCDIGGDGRPERFVQRIAAVAPRSSHDDTDIPWYPLPPFAGPGR